jgi:hypothetical protein
VGNVVTVVGNQNQKVNCAASGHFPGNNALFIACQDVLRSIVRKQNIQSGEQRSKHVRYVRPEKVEDKSYFELYTAFSTKEEEISVVGVMLMFLQMT